MLSLYKKATKDFDLRNVTGTLRVWRGDFRCLLDRNLVKRRRVRPVLGRKEYPRVNIRKCLDNDQLNRPQAPDSEVYTHDVPPIPRSPLTSCCLRGFVVSLLMA